MKRRHMSSTVKDHWKGCDQQKFEFSKKARIIYHIIGSPTTKNYNHLLRQNIINNLPVQINDVNLTNKVFCPSIEALEVKSTMIKIKPVKFNVVEIIPELINQHKDLTHYMDIMYVNKMPILTGIDRTIRYRYHEEY